jgi:glycosyltransferase involved in cell wall biosynthesis
MRPDAVIKLYSGSFDADVRSKAGKHLKTRLLECCSTALCLDLHSVGVLQRISTFIRSVQLNRSRIGVDLLVLSQFSHTGVVTFVQAILPRLIEAFPDCEWVLFSRSDGLGFDYSHFPNVRVKESSWMRSDWLWKLFGVSAESIIEKLDFLFMPVSRVPLLKRCPVAAIIYDLGFTSLPEYLKRGSVTRTAISVKSVVKHSDIIFTISNFMKREICDTYGTSHGKVVIAPCGHNPSDFNAIPVTTSEAEAVLSSYGIRRPYVLYLGVIQRRKNLVKLIDAYDRCHVASPELQLVLAGKRGWDCDQIYSRAAVYPSSEVCLPGAIKREHLRVVYQQAECYVLPSLYEGFGIPVLEAMACGTPTILSTAGALPEVGGRAALYFDPASADEIADKILSLHRSPQLRNQLSRIGRIRAAQFTWDSSARAIADALQSFFSGSIRGVKAMPATS